jgi:hypothetical protein
LIFGPSRDWFYSFRREIRCRINRKRVNRQHLNLDIYRVNADYVSTQVKGWSIGKNRYADLNLNTDAVISDLCNDESLVVYLKLDTSSQMRRKLDIIFKEFTGTFVIDPGDMELTRIPTWANSKAKLRMYASWAALLTEY